MSFADNVTMNKQINKKSFLWLAVLLLACSDDSENRIPARSPCADLPYYDGPHEPPWVSGLSFHGPNTRSWENDNRILETDHFFVFSDASSDQAKIRLGELAEENLDHIKDFFAVSDHEIGLGDGRKYQIFSIQCDGGSVLGQFGAMSGFAVFAFDSSLYLNWPEEYQQDHERVICHENVHTVHFQLTQTYRRRQDWFTEGLADHVSGTTERINTWDELVAWRANRPNFNPVGLEFLTELPVGPLRWGEYYPLFNLAVEYLLHPQGLGKTGSDVTRMLMDIRSGAEFEDAFLNHMGLGVGDYRNNFNSWIELFLKGQGK